MKSKSHWEEVYKSKPTHEVSWYQPHLAISLELIRESGIAQNAHIIDVGGGASTFADDLLKEGYKHYGSGYFFRCDSALENPARRTGG